MRLDGLPGVESEIKGFNPRICKRCDATGVKIRGYVVVSIHASVKDATYGVFVSRRCLCVSIHASVKDATPSKIP